MELCRLENDLNIYSGYTHDFTQGKYSSFTFAVNLMRELTNDSNTELLIKQEKE